MKRLNARSGFAYALAMLMGYLAHPHAVLAADAQVDVTHSVNCSSVAPRGYTECKAGGLISTVSLDQEFSAVMGTCRDGTTWGYSEDTIWVRNGCDARFDVDVVPGPQYPALVPCASQGTRSTCPVGFVVGSATLQHQTSEVPCVEGTSWGFDASEIWVDEGCSGAFVVYQATSN